MKTYKYQMHTHTSPTSRCAVMTPRELAVALYDGGYQGAVITNHFYLGNSGVDRSIPWCDFVREYEKDYEACREAAKEYGLDIIFGIEEHIGGGREILLYGISPEVLYAHPELKGAGIEVWSEVVRGAGALVIQAHPYRERAYITAPYPLPIEYIDGIEVYNAANIPEANEAAEKFAVKNPQLILTSGADTHKSVTACLGGIECRERITDSKTLVRTLKSGEYRVIKG